MRISDRLASGGVRYLSNLSYKRIIGEPSTDDVFLLTDMLICAFEVRQSFSILLLKKCNQIILYNNFIVCLYRIKKPIASFKNIKVLELIKTTRLSLKKHIDLLRICMVRQNTKVQYVEHDRGKKGSLIEMTFPESKVKVYCQ